MVLTRTRTSLARLTFRASTHLNSSADGRRRSLARVFAVPALSAFLSRRASTEDIGRANGRRRFDAAVLVVGLEAAVTGVARAAEFAVESSAPDGNIVGFGVGVGCDERSESEGESGSEEGAHVEKRRGSV